MDLDACHESHAGFAQKKSGQFKQKTVVTDMVPERWQASQHQETLKPRKGETSTHLALTILTIGCYWGKVTRRSTQSAEIHHGKQLDEVKGTHIHLSQSSLENLLNTWMGKGTQLCHGRFPLVRGLSSLHLGDNSELSNPTLWERKNPTIGTGAAANSGEQSPSLGKRTHCVIPTRPTTRRATLEQQTQANRAVTRRSDSVTHPSISIPSTPTISTPLSITLSPITPPPPPEEPTTSNYEMAPIELFCGDACGDKPHYWLRKLQGSMAYDAKEEEKLHRFQMGLTPGTVADKWWTVLDAKEKVLWSNVVKAFEKKWVVLVEAEESMEELKSRSKRTILNSADLGKLVGPPATRCTPIFAGHGHEAARQEHQRPNNAAEGQCARNAPPRGANHTPEVQADVFGDIFRGS
ncbi:hypothetical protein B0H10DRAFT_1941747 [Mycena sp. CBHHK59/15]|nr:hypothetical protein B0H10DRAFT_1941747 [Mycena sp. CBHHK59/15]